jgi:TrmH family RNA methyltransferase
MFLLVLPTVQLTYLCIYYVLPMSFLDRIKIVLVEPTHPGNIGAAARSAKTMGLGNLVLVKPKKYPHYEASKRAAGAEDVLDKATVVADLRSALVDCTLVYGTSVRDREVSWPTTEPRAAAERAQRHLMPEPQHQAAIVFGRENSGLSNSELEMCHVQIRIPANPDYSSLNLASAVQIIAYEMRLMALADNSADMQIGNNEKPPTALSAAQKRQLSASHSQQLGHLQHLEETLALLDFAKSPKSPMLMRKLSRLYNKAQLTVEEVQILRGILSAIESSVNRS